MGLKFDKLPVNTLVGARWDTFKALTRENEIAKGYRSKYCLTKAVCRILSSLQPLEDRRYRKLEDTAQADPLFILGHWRSGTTFVHNVFACDKHFGFTTTYQTVFPNSMLFGQPFFKAIANALIPDSRPTDNMELKVDMPQEEEFALASMMPFSYYNFWYFPQKMMEYCDRYLTFETIPDDERQVFMDNFRRLVKTALWNTGGTQFLSKNPPHTGRISTLLEMYPDAKFIYLKRNPYTVFESTRSFFTNTIRPLKLHDVSNEQLEANIIEVYKRLYARYELEKHLIPEGNLVEIKFEDFEEDAFGMTRDLYGRLGLPGFEESEKAIAAYIDQKKSYRKNDYKYEDRTVKIVEENWNMALENWGYSL